MNDDLPKPEPEPEPPEPEPEPEPESNLDQIITTLRGINGIGKFRDGDDLITVLRTIQEEIIMPDELNGFDRAEEFTSHYLPFSKGPGDVNTKKGLVKTPKHIAQLMCDIAEVTVNSKVLDITCGTGTFLTAAYEAMDATATPEQRANIGNNLFGIDRELQMWATAQNQLSIKGVSHTNIVRADCFDEAIKARVREFNPDITLFNPPFNTDENYQPKRPLEFLKRACDLTADGGIVVALMPLSHLLMPSQNRATFVGERKELLAEHRVLATMELPGHIFSLLPKEKDTPTVAPAIIVMKAHRAHFSDPIKESGDRDVWMGMWLTDGKKHKDKTGLIEDPVALRNGHTWEMIRAQWVQSYHNLTTIQLQDIPSKGNLPPFGASHQRKIAIQNDDWIASSKIPNPINTDENFLEMVGDVWSEYIGYLKTMRKKR